MNNNEERPRWAVKLQEHRDRFPNHNTARDASYCGYTYCYDCHRYINN